MRNDLNFFSAYQGRKREKTDDKKYIYSIAAILATIIIGTLIYNTINLFNVKNDIEDYKVKLSDSTFLKKLSETEKEEKKSSDIKKYSDGLTSITAALDSRTAVSSEILNALSSTLPSEVSFSSIDVKKDVILIQAQSSKRVAIAEVEYNLSKLDIVQDVYVGSITDNSGIFVCDIKCSLKDVE